MHLDGIRIGIQTALPRAYQGWMLIMFKITQKTIHQFSFVEILLMAAINEIEAGTASVHAELSRTGGGDDR